MRILALQLKRIGDLVLTTPALRALRTAWPEAHIALGVSEGCSALLGAIATIDTGIVFGRGRGFAPWQQALTGPWDLCLDFTGTDRSALASALSRARGRATFASVRRNRVRALAYSRFVDSSVRERHTVDHYLDLLRPLIDRETASALPELHLPDTARIAASELLRAQGVGDSFVLLHPGTARVEKYWLTERWAEVADTLHGAHGMEAVVTCGPDGFERAHVEEIKCKMQNAKCKVLNPTDLIVLAALAERARLVISCDTAMVHFAAAFRVPQIALFGPTNPFHWRPMHDRAVVISAAQPTAPLTKFTPRMRGAPMEGISTEVVNDVIAQLILNP